MFKNLFNSKRGLNSILGMLFATLMTPFVMAIHQVEEPGGGGAGDTALLEKVQKKLDEKSTEQLKTLQGELRSMTEEVKKGIITTEQFEEKTKDFTEKLKEFDPEKYAEYVKSIEKLEKALTVQGEEMKKLTDSGIGREEAKGLRHELAEIVKSEDFKDMVSSNGKKKAEFKLKTVSVTSDYTGTSRVHITTRDSRVVDHPQVIRLNIRDLMNVAPTDLPYLAFTEVYDWVRAVRPHGENESLVESSFKIREAVTDAKRIGTSVPISKRMLKSATYVASHLAVQLPAQVKYNEDFQLLFGDGQGNNPLGIFNVASDFAALVNASITGNAGSVASIEGYKGTAQTLVTFAANTLLNNGDVITFAATTGTTYNGAYNAIVISPTQIIIEQAYTADAGVANWTFVAGSQFKDAIEAAQQIDVLKVGKTLVTQQEYSCNGYVLNPVDAAKIEMLKGNDEHYIEVMRDASGILRIAGVPVVETTAMPAGKFAMGDWALAAAIYEFTQLTLEFSESTQEKLKNSVMAIIQEEILFPIYNKYMFVTGDFTTAIAAIAV